MTFLLVLWNLSAKTKLIILGIILTAAVVCYVGYLSHQASVAVRERKAAEAEQKRLADQNEGLKILQNTNTIAGEITREKQIANQQQINSNASNADFTNSVQRASNSFSGNYTETRQRFCGNFPDDPRCRK